MPWKECSVMDERMQFVASRRSDSLARRATRSSIATSLRLCLQGNSVTVNANDGTTNPVNYTFGTVN
jgi:hypothetical protein